jgi:hypothetical protein
MEMYEMYEMYEECRNFFPIGSSSFFLIPKSYNLHTLHTFHSLRLFFLFFNHTFNYIPYILIFIMDEYMLKQVIIRLSIE